MPKYSSQSQNKLATCHEDIQKVFNEVIRWFDNTIIYGRRNKEDQNAAYEAGNSKLQYPYSNHNKNPSMAVDAVPYPINWGDRERMTLFAGFVLGIASKFGIKLRWGGNWSMDWQVQNNSFDDLAHFELVNMDD